MATTVTLVYCVGSTAMVAHVGDSRCYLFRDGALRRLTEDHTMVQELVRSGAVKTEQARNHRLRHVVTNIVGGRRPALDVELHRLTLQPHDVLLLCSDGLTEMLDEAELAMALETEPDPRTACEGLVAEANRRGGHDNVTVVLARFDEERRLE
jgi:protein phosphatase